MFPNVIWQKTLSHNILEETLVLNVHFSSGKKPYVTFSPEIWHILKKKVHSEIGNTIISNSKHILDHTGKFP